MENIIIHPKPKLMFFQVKEGERVRGQNNGESRHKEFCKNSVVSGERERNWKTRQMS